MDKEELTDEDIAGNIDLIMEKQKPSTTKRDPSQTEDEAPSEYEEGVDSVEDPDYDEKNYGFENIKEEYISR